MKFNKWVAILLIGMGTLGMSACSSSGDTTQDGDDNGSGDNNESTSVTYDYTGTMLLAKTTAFNALVPAGVTASVGVIGFNQSAGTVDTAANTYFESVTGVDLSTAFCVNDDSLSDVSTDSIEEDSTSSTEESTVISAGEAALSADGQSVATITVSDEAVYNTLVLLPDVLDYDTAYDIAFAGNADTLVVPEFSVTDLLVADSSPVTLDGTLLSDLVDSGDPVQGGALLVTDLTWTAMASLSGPDEDSTDFGYQLVQVVGMNDNDEVIGTVQCFLPPDRGGFVSGDDTSAVSALAGATKATVAIEQFHVKMGFPESGDDQGFVTAIGAASQIFTGINITQ